jgi:hypothetical protein
MRVIPGLTRTMLEAHRLSNLHPNLYVRIYCWTDTKYLFIRVEPVPVTELEGQAVQLIHTYHDGETVRDSSDAAPASGRHPEQGGSHDQFIGMFGWNPSMPKSKGSNQ